MKKIGLATALLLAMTGAQAYQFEIQGQSEHIDAKDNGSSDFTGSVAATYYFKNVDTSKGPLAEAAFLNQTANVSAAYNYASLDYGIDKDEYNTYGIRGEYYSPTKIPVYVSGAYSHTNFKYSLPDASWKDNSDRYAVEVGAVATPGFLMAIGYTNSTDYVALDPNFIINNGFSKSLDEHTAISNQNDAVTARMKYVGPITGTKAAIGFEALLVSGENNFYQLKSDVFFSPTFSVGASFASIDSYYRYDTWGVNVEKFITPKFALGANYTNSNARNGASDWQTIGVNAKYRF